MTVDPLDVNLQRLRRATARRPGAPAVALGTNLEAVRPPVTAQAPVVTRAAPPQVEEKAPERAPISNNLPSTSSTTFETPTGQDQQSRPSVEPHFLDKILRFLVGRIARKPS